MLEIFEILSNCSLFTYIKKTKLKQLLRDIHSPVEHWDYL